MNEYFDKKEFLEQLKISKTNKVASNRLVEMFIDLIKRRLNCDKYKNLSWELKQEALSFACLDFCRYWHKFDMRKRMSPFAYFTQFANYGVCAAIKKYKRDISYLDDDGIRKLKSIRVNSDF